MRAPDIAKRNLIVKRKLKGASNLEIAAETGMHPVTVSRNWTDPETQAIVARARAACEPIISKLISRVYETLLEDLDRATKIDDRTKLRAENERLRGEATRSMRLRRALEAIEAPPEVLDQIRSALAEVTRG